jgi:PadR family transcriptional regulator, regulatory protein PadR
MDKNTLDSENISSQMRKGMLEFCVLLVIAQEEIYASDIITQLQKADLLVVEGTLYPLLSRLRSGGDLDYTWVESPSGPPRKYYKLTAKGRQRLNTLKKSWKEFTSSINSLVKEHEQNN